MPIATTPIAWIAIRSGGSAAGLGAGKAASAVTGSHSWRLAQERVDAESSRAVDHQKQETADDGKMLQAGGDLLLTRRTRESRGAVRQQRGDHREAEQGQRRQAGPETQQDHQPGADLTEDRERQ